MKYKLNTYIRHETLNWYYLIHTSLEIKCIFTGYDAQIEILVHGAQIF